jgi:hypothetical protein
VPIPLSYKGKRIDCCFRADFLVEDLVLVEVKSVQAINNGTEFPKQQVHANKIIYQSATSYTFWLGGTGLVLKNWTGYFMLNLPAKTLAFQEKIETGGGKPTITLNCE